MSVAARLLLLVALLCGALGLVAAVTVAATGVAMAHAGCPHETAQAAPAAGSAHTTGAGDATVHVASGPSVASATHHPSPAKARLASTAEFPIHSHAGGPSMPSGPSCCSGSGCLMTCHWVVPTLDLAPGPDGPGQRVGFALSGERPAVGPEVQLPPPRHQA